MKDVTSYALISSWKLQSAKDSMQIYCYIVFLATIPSTHANLKLGQKS